MSALRGGLWLALALGMTASTSPARAVCAPAQLEAGLGLASSRWREDGASGERLLEERGSLPAWSLAVAGPCAGLQWAARVDGLSGSRDYQGRSSAGLPLVTRSQVQAQRLSLQAWHALAGGAWALGGRLGWEPGDRRELASVGPVQGYEERRARWRLGLGVSWRHALPAGWSGSWEAWLDTGPHARLSLSGEAFGSQTVRVGEGRWQATTLSWLASPAPQAGHWQPWLGWQWENLRSRAGGPELLRMDSGRMLVVSQPSYRRSDWRLLAGLRWTLP